MHHKLRELYAECRLCGRNCGVDRLAGETGFCGESAQMRIATICLHKGEEPPLVGDAGSGTVFFTGCTLQCGFCQNLQISREGLGGVMTVDELAGWILKIEHAGGANVNFVTGTHFAPSIAAAVAEARRRGSFLPVVWNCSGFETERTLEILAPYIDVYLPDLKVLDEALARRLFGFDGYPAIARRAMLAMARHAGKAVFRNDAGGNPLLTRGMLLRHLVLPGEMDNTRAVLQYYAENLRDTALLSLMVQYIPPPETENGVFPQRGVSSAEYDQLLAMLDHFTIDEGFLQELEPESPWYPDFRRRNPFPEGYAEGLWHFSDSKGDPSPKH